MEHNPVALLITKIQQKWNTEASPNKELKLVRWVLRPDQGRIFEGFLKLESSPHGSIPEFVLVLLTPFKDIQDHSRDLALQWIDSFEKDKAALEVMSGSDFHQQITHFKKELSNSRADYHSTLIQMMSSFQKSIPDPDQRFVLALLPSTVSNPSQYVKWVEMMVKAGISEKCLMMIFDYQEEQYFEGVAIKYPNVVKSLSVEMDVKGALDKIAQAGDPNSPEVQFRICMMEMSKAVSDNNIDRLHSWGKRGLEITQKTGNKGFFSSAHLIYAGMLFQFQKFEEVESLLNQGHVLAQQGLKAGDQTCLSLELQYLGYKAACLQHKSKWEEAGNLFLEQGEKAHSHQLTLSALTSWWQAYSLYKKCNDKKYTQVLEKAYTEGKVLSVNELQSSCMSYIAYDYYQYLHNLRQFDTCNNIDSFMFDVEGPNWKDNVEKYKEDTKRKRFLFF